MDWDPGYREKRPPAGLLPSVTCLWARVAGPGAGAVAAVLPDACVDLIWEQGKGVFVAGPDTGPVSSVMPAGTVLAALRFAPGAAGPALGLPMSELLNLRVDAADLGTGPGRDLARALPGSLAPARALATLARLAQALTAAGPADPLAAHAARMLRHPGARAEDIAVRLEVSERQLRRRCQAAVGYGPATLRRVLRFRRFVSWADAGAPGGDLATASAELGYADQAHLTRECARLAGLTPAALLATRQRQPASAALRSTWVTRSAARVTSAAGAIRLAHGHPLAGQVVERAGDVARVTLLYDILKAEALPRQASIDLARKAIGTWT